MEKLKLYILKNGYYTEIAYDLFKSIGCNCIGGGKGLMNWCGGFWIEFETEEDLAQFTLSWL